MTDSPIEEGLSEARRRAVRFLDRAIQLGLLLALVVLPLGFPRFLIVIPFDVFPFSALIPKSMLSSHTPLNLKEALAMFVAIDVLALWLIRSVLSGQLRLVWTPLHLPFVVLVGLAGLTLIAPQARPLRLRDFGLLLGYVGFTHLFLLYGWRKDFRRISLNLFLAVSAVFTAIVFAMDRQWYFGPFKMAVSDHNRQSLYATIGHNIAVASYLMLIAVYVLGRAIEVRSLWKRLLYGAWVVLVVDLIVAAQTVGVWLAMVLLVPLVLVLLLRVLRTKSPGGPWRQKGLRWVLGAVLVLGVLLAGLFTLNEIARRDRPGSTPMERLKMRLDPSILARGTRARLWLVSLNLVRDRFPLGVGFSAFKYIYAEEQARYFREHPDSILVPTNLHTDRVHNEYLQVWVELGAAGLAALLWGILVLVRMQVRLLRAGRLRGREQLRATTAFVALSATLIHVLTSFEFHVPTTALFFVLGLSLWVGEGRLGQLKEFSLANLALAPRLGIVLSLMVGLSALGITLLPGSHVVADSFYCLGEFLRKQDGGYPQAAEFYDRARRLAPYRGQVAYHEAVAVFQLGEQSLARHDTGTAIRYYQRADQLLSEALKTYQFKDIYLQRAEARGKIGLLTGRDDILNLAVQDYLQTIQIYPSDLLAYYKLGKLYYGSHRRNLAFEIWEKAQEYDFDFMRDYHIVDAEHMRSLGRDEMAMEYYRMAIILNPKNGDYYWPLLDLFERSRRYGEGVSLLKALLEFYPADPWIRARMAELELASGNREAAETQLKRILETDPPTYQSVQAAEHCYRLLGQDLAGVALLEDWLAGRWEQRFTLEEYAVILRLDEAYERLGRTEEQEAFWKRFLALSEDQLLPTLRSRALARFAEFYVSQGRLVEAIALQRQRTQLPDLPEGHGLKACMDVLALMEWALTF